MEVANSIMLYGSEIWTETLKVKKLANSHVSVQITKCTKSAPAVLVIAGTLPVDKDIGRWTSRLLPDIRPYYGRK